MDKVERLKIERDKLKEFEKSRVQGKYQEQDKFRKEFERSRVQGKHQEQDKFRKKFKRSRVQGKYQE